MGCGVWGGWGEYILHVCDYVNMWGGWGEYEYLRGGGGGFVARGPNTQEACDKRPCMSGSAHTPCNQPTIVAFLDACIMLR
jgi:hypothetical protein